MPVTVSPSEIWPWLISVAPLMCWQSREHWNARHGSVVGDVELAVGLELMGHSVGAELVGEPVGRTVGEAVGDAVFHSQEWPGVVQSPSEQRCVAAQLQRWPAQLEPSHTCSQIP